MLQSMFMSLLVDFFPIVIFFGVFKWKDLMAATIAAMLVSFIQLIITKIKTNKFQYLQLISFLSLFILGSFALVCKKEIFIKWKPTAIYWLLAIIFLGTHIFNKQPLLEKLSNNTLQLPKKVWAKLNILWIIFFIFMGTLNLYIVYHFDTNTWVNFKLFGTLGLTTIFVVFQAIFLSKYLRVE